MRTRSAAMLLTAGWLLALLIRAPAGRAAEAPDRWSDPFYSYRVRMALESKASGKTAIAAPCERVLEALHPVCVDVLNQDTFAFDKAILVDPAGGKTVGGYRLVPTAGPIDVDGDFANLSSGKPSKWAGSGMAGISFEDAEAGSAKFKAMVVTSSEIANRQLAQDLELKPGQLYLLEYWIRPETTQENLYVTLHNPAKQLFAEVPGSYYPKVTAEGKWAHQLVLYRPETARCQLRIATGFVGRASVGAISLHPVEWALIADLPAPADRLDLYAVMSAGHRMTQPDRSLLAEGRPATSVAVQRMMGESADLNPNGVLVDAGDGVRVWSLPAYLPLRGETMRATVPRKSAAAIGATLLRGQSTTVVLAVETGTPQAVFPQAACDLPFSPRFERVASIPVFDSFFPAGKKVETRYDASVDPNFSLCPPDENGIHLITCTLAAPADAKPGTIEGRVKLGVQTQEPVTKAIELPVRVTVAGPLVKPMRHFATQFGGQEFTVRYPRKEGMWVREMVSVADFHGYPHDIPADNWVARLSLPDMPDARKAPIRQLAREYYQRMLDFDVIPQSWALFSWYTYKVEPVGEGKAPRLTNWDFAEYDKAIDELALERDVPWLNIWHANGHNMDMFLLSDGVIYAPRPKPADYEEPWEWKQIERAEYLKLVAEYFETLAGHLDAKGVLDRALIVMDESGESTFQLMYDVKQALAAQPHAGRIKWGHTAQKTTFYTEKLPDGRLMMDQVFDVPMPLNDEHWNFFEPELAGRMKRPGMQPWVYYVETDHFNLNNAGLSTLITPLKLRHFGVKGWYNWASFLWSYPTPDYKLMGPEYPNGPMVNPWLNPFYHHGNGMCCFFYPPDPRGPATQPTDRIVPSYRLGLIRDGIQDYAMLDVLAGGMDDAGRAVPAGNRSRAAEAQALLDRMWAPNPVQWYLSYESYRRARELIYSAPADGGSAAGADRETDMVSN